MVTSQLQATQLFIIAKDLKKMEAEIDVDESDIGLIKVGQVAVFTVDAFPQRSFSGVIKQIHYDYKIVENVITYAVVLNVSNPDLSLRPGMTTNVDIKVAQAKNSLVIPNKALRVSKEALKKIAAKEELNLQELQKTIENKSKDTIWILENGNLIREIPVKLGVNDGKFTQILGTINENTQVIVEALDPERENPVFAMGKLKV